MSYTIFLTNENDKIVLTDQEIQGAINANAPEDIIGVENDLKALIDSRNTTSMPIRFHIYNLSPLHVASVLGEEPDWDTFI